jgi:hypothetical protein
MEKLIMTTMQESTASEDYARGILHDIRRLEIVSDRWPEYPSVEALRAMADEWYTDLVERRYTFTAVSASDTWEDIARARADADWLEETIPDHRDGDPYVVEYVAGALECTYRGTLDQYGGNGWVCDTVEVLVTFGGPNAWISWNDRNPTYVTVETRWGSDSASIPTYAGHLAGYLEGLAECVS